MTLKMTSALVVELSVTKNSYFQNYPHPADHTIQTTDTPGFTDPFTKSTLSRRDARLDLHQQLQDCETLRNVVFAS